MELREKFEKENGHNVYAYRQDYAGARPYQDGFNDEYVEWLENKVQNLSLCAVSQRSELLTAFLKWYWQNVDGRPSDESISDIIDAFGG